MEKNWEWVYASISGTGEMLFQVPEDVRRELLAGKFPDSFPFRNITTLKMRPESAEEVAARIKRNKNSPQVADLVIETFKWVMAKEGVADSSGIMTGKAIMWIVLPTEAICHAAADTWEEKNVFIANQSHLDALERSKAILRQV